MSKYKWDNFESQRPKFEVWVMTTWTCSSCTRTYRERLLNGKPPEKCNNCMRGERWLREQYPRK